MLQKLRILSRDAKELDLKLTEMKESFDRCMDLVSSMEAISDKVSKVFILYKELVGLMDL